MAECADHLDCCWRNSGADWRDCEPAGVCLLLAAGVHVLPEYLPGIAFPGDRAPSVRCGVVGAHPAILRAYRDHAISVHAAAVLADRGAGAKNLSLDDGSQSETGSFAASQATVVQPDMVLHCGGGMFR